MITELGKKRLCPAAAVLHIGFSVWFSLRAGREARSIPMALLWARSTLGCGWNCLVLFFWPPPTSFFSKSLLVATPPFFFFLHFSQNLRPLIPSRVLLAVFTASSVGSNSPARASLSSRLCWYDWHLLLSSQRESSVSPSKFFFFLHHYFLSGYCMCFSHARSKTSSKRLLGHLRCFHLFWHAGGSNWERCLGFARQTAAPRRHWHPTAGGLYHRARRLQHVHAWPGYGMLQIPDRLCVPDAGNKRNKLNQINLVQFKRRKWRRRRETTFPGTVHICSCCCVQLLLLRVFFTSVRCWMFAQLHAIHVFFPVLLPPMSVLQRHRNKQDKTLALC